MHKHLNKQKACSQAQKTEGNSRVPLSAGFPCRRPWRISEVSSLTLMNICKLPVNEREGETGGHTERERERDGQSENEMIKNHM